MQSSGFAGAEMCKVILCSWLQRIREAFGCLLGNCQASDTIGEFRVGQAGGA